MRRERRDKAVAEEKPLAVEHTRPTGIDVRILDNGQSVQVDGPASRRMNVEVRFPGTGKPVRLKNERTLCDDMLGDVIMLTVTSTVLCPVRWGFCNTINA